MPKYPYAYLSSESINLTYALQVALSEHYHITLPWNIYRGNVSDALSSTGHFSH